MRKLWYRDCASSWYEALPVGNGRIGAMVFGAPVFDRIQINEETLWSGCPYGDEPPYDMQKIQEIRDLITNRDYVSAQEKTRDFMPNNETAVYVSYGFVNIDLISDKTQVSNYYRELDIESATTTTTYTLGDNKIEKKVFVSLADDVIVYRIKGEKPFELRITECCELRHEISADEGVITVKGRCPTYASTMKKIVRYEEDKESVPFCSMLKVVGLDGATNVHGQSSLRVTGRDVMLVFAIKTGFNGYDKMPISQGKEYENACKQSLESACALSFDELLSRHEREYKKYFDRVSFTLEGEDYDEPTDERIERFCEGREDNKLITLAFDYARYLTVSANGIGTQPTNLQGIWCDDLTPPWRCNYTVNINTQMNYWATETCDLPEMQMPLFNMLKDLSKRGNAFGKKGWSLFHNTDLWRANRVMTKNPQWGWSLTNGAWLCRHIYEHYAHTRDEQFLRDYYEVMQGMADFLQDFMTETDGKLVLSPSSSPENEFVFDGKNCAVTEGTAIDLATCYDFFDKFIKINEVLGKDNAKNEEILSKLKPISFTGDGRIMEWNEDFEETEPGHRHLSPLYGFFPADVLGKEYEDAVKKTFEHRLSYGSGYTGWSCVWVANIYARLKNNEKAMEWLRKYFKLIRKNMLCTCGVPFQIDGNYGVASVICEMLLQDHRGEVETLPTLPKEWRHGEVKGFVTRTGEKIDFKW